MHYLKLTPPQHARVTEPGPARLAPVPAPLRVQHTRAALYDLSGAYRRALAYDDRRDTWTPARPVQLALSFAL